VSANVQVVGQTYHYVNRGLLYRPDSIDPVSGTLNCDVAGCPKEWYLSGGKSGFVMAAAMCHALAHNLKVQQASCTHAWEEPTDWHKARGYKRVCKKCAFFSKKETD
jgi:hypothetical protein